MASRQAIGARRDDDAAGSRERPSGPNAGRVHTEPLLPHHEVVGPVEHDVRLVLAGGGDRDVEHRTDRGAERSYPSSDHVRRVPDHQEPIGCRGDRAPFDERPRVEDLPEPRGRASPPSRLPNDAPFPSRSPSHTARYRRPRPRQPGRRAASTTPSRRASRRGRALIPPGSLGRRRCRSRTRSAGRARRSATTAPTKPSPARTGRPSRRDRMPAGSRTCRWLADDGRRTHRSRRFAVFRSSRQATTRCCPSQVTAG